MFSYIIRNLLLIALMTIFRLWSLNVRQFGNLVFFNTISSFLDFSQTIGKGSLWCVDPEYRPNLMQTLRKTPSFQPFGQWTTPPPSPQSSNGSATKVLESRLRQSELLVTIRLSSAGHT